MSASNCRNPAPIHVVEPTLEDYAGHCYELTRSLCEAATGRSVTVWGGKGAAQLSFGPEVTLRLYFLRRLRTPQLLWLFLRLLRNDDPVVLTTARRADLVLANLAACGKLRQGKLFLYFHWFRETPNRLAFLRRMARVQPGISILATTDLVAEVFRRAGFVHVVTLPYPLTAQPARAGRGEPRFRHLLYAGAARQEKGFGKIVDLVERLRETGEDLPVTVQVSAEHYGKYEDKTIADIKRLERSGYAALTLIRETLQPDQYAALYQGAICIQPYEPQEFRDRVSGVTMDALAYGSPVIVPANTWMARIVEPYSAGIAVKSLDAGSIFDAVRSLIGDYARFSRNAIQGGNALRARSWKPLLDLIDANA
jgi:glycosyltransferase involved in cell wall biosynthesis